jgi:multicomponent K+:H+ antiporter subunit E
MQKRALLDRWFPHPFVSFLIFVTWLMLSHSLDITDIFIAILLGIFVSRLVSPFIARTPHIHWLPAIKLFCGAMGYCDFQLSCS